MKTIKLSTKNQHQMAKLSILLIALLMLFSCNEKIPLSDAYGNFEATATTISAEANGRLLFLLVEEGERLESGNLVALIDTTQLHLQRKQIRATINTLPKK